jgi:hypothetical protein
MIREHERGLLFVDREFKDVLRPGTVWIADPFGRVRVDVVSVHDVWLAHSDLAAIVRSGALGPEVEVVSLGESERAVVWVNRRVERVLEPGLYALWTVFHEVHVDVVEARVLDRPEGPVGTGVSRLTPGVPWPPKQPDLR